MAARRGSGELEAEVLGVLWAADGPLTPAAVRDQVGPDLAYNTVMTILRRLFDKGLARRAPAPSGRAFCYSPAVDRAEHAAQQMHAFLAETGDTPAVLTRFLGHLDAKERRTLAELLRRKAR